MSRGKEIIVEIDENGNAKIEAFNFIGPACESVINELVSILGKTDKIEKKRDYYQRVLVDQRERTRR